VDSQACSICLCGDDLFFYADARTLLRHRFELTFQEQYMTKSAGPTELHQVSETAAALPADVAHTDNSQETLHEHRLTLRGSYRVNRTLSFFAKLPMLFRHSTTVTNGVGETDVSSGLGDLEMSATLSRELISHPNSSCDGAIVLGLKTPTGRSALMKDGERIDEHLQPGTGSWGGQGGVILSRTTMKYSAYASGYIRTTAENDYGYRYGNAYLYNFGYLVRTGPLWALTAEINGRYAKRDKLSGAELHNTGGSVAYLTPGARFLVSPRVNLIVNVRIPVIQRLNDNQKEGIVVVGEIGLRR
jgi:hypothetical protein